MKTIIKQVSENNTTYNPNRTIKYIVLHYTAGLTSKAGSALNVAKMFAKSDRQASADYIVDDETIVQYNPDVKNRHTWAVGGTKYKTMTTTLGGKCYTQCSNRNSISIEMCSNKIDKLSMNATDADWYFTEKTLNNALELTVYLVKLYKIPISNIIMHHEVTGKICPNPWCLNEGRLSGYYTFIKRVQEQINPIKDKGDKPVDIAKLYQDLQKYAASQPIPEWAKAEYNEAIKLGITDGSNPSMLIPRYQTAIMVKRAMEKINK